METQNRDFLYLRNYSLFILPMRNGNIESRVNIVNLPFFLFILPMRNGNDLMKELNIYTTLYFLSYLWGMETWHDRWVFCYSFPFYPTYEEWKPKDETTKKLKYQAFYPTYEEWKPFIKSAGNVWVFITFYPTYEEWKLLNLSVMEPGDLSFYPTYEEWKLTCCSL